MTKFQNRRREPTRAFGTPATLYARAQDVFTGEEGIAFAEAIAMWNKKVMHRYGENSMVIMAAKLGDVKNYLDSLG